MHEKHKIKNLLSRALRLPINATVNYGFALLRKKMTKLKKVSLEKEMVHVSNKNAIFPFALFRSHMTGSKETAERILDHEFDLLGSGPAKLGKYINWHFDFKHGFHFLQKPIDEIHYDFSGGKDIKIPWELSRFQFLPTLARAYELHHDEKYAHEARELIHDWILKNPLSIGVNWKCTMDTAIRACNFALAWYFLKESLPWQEDRWRRAFLTSMVEHGKFILRNLEYGPGFNSNHFLADITGLLFLGVLFPEFREAKKWKNVALKGFKAEMQKQVYEDGVDFEASIPYHRLVTEFFGYSALLCRMNNISLSRAFWERLEKMFEFVWYYTKPNGLAPQIGDNDDGRLFIFEDFYAWERRDHRHLFWLAKELFSTNKKFIQTMETEKMSSAFQQSGIYIMRSSDFYCIVDTGNGGQAGNGGHAHNDMFSFELSMSGEDFIIDPGTYVYTSDPLARNEFRSTRMHNTVMIDGEEMNRFRSDTLFSMHGDAKPKIHRWESDENQDLLDAQHSGYERLHSPVIHRRTFLFNKNDMNLEITDFFLGKEQHKFEWNFHFAPGVNVEKKGDRIFAGKNGKKMEMRLPQALAPYAEIIDGEISPRYGVKEKAKVLKIQKEMPVHSYENSFHFSIFSS